jgi:PKD domain
VFSIKTFSFSILLPIAVFVGALDATSTHAAQCTNNVCIEVHTDPTTGKVIIDATKKIPGLTPAPVAPKPVSHPTVIPIPKPSAKRTVNPTPRPYVRHVPYVYHPPKPKPAATITTPKEVAEVNLADQISQLLPMRHIYIQPANGVIAQLPTYFWTDTNPLFTTATKILGISVGVTLDPTFLWQFGDGSSFITTQPGAELPDKTITHVYKKAGRFTCTLTVSWLGNWNAGGYSYPVTGGAIIQSYSTIVTVAPAPTLFGN